jgi:hypothetical protein
MVGPEAQGPVVHTPRRSPAARLRVSPPPHALGWIGLPCTWPNIPRRCRAQRISRGSGAGTNEGRVASCCPRNLSVLDSLRRERRTVAWVYLRIVLIGNGRSVIESQTSIKPAAIGVDSGPGAVPSLPRASRSTAGSPDDPGQSDRAPSRRREGANDGRSSGPGSSPRGHSVFPPTGCADPCAPRGRVAPLTPNHPGHPGSRPAAGALAGRPRGPRWRPGSHPKHRPSG